MLPRVQFFRNDHKLTACALGEPLLTLVRNDTQFGLLIAAGAHEDSSTGRFYLDAVSYLRIQDEELSYADFASVAVFENEGVWFAQDVDSRLYFPNPSGRAYHVVFISHAEFHRIQYARTEGLAFPVFESAQRCFGRLPGFSFANRMLEVPADYANRADAVSLSDYVLAGE